MLLLDSEETCLAYFIMIQWHACESSLCLGLTVLSIVCLIGVILRSAALAWYVSGMFLAILDVLFPLLHTCA